MLIFPIVYFVNYLSIGLSTVEFNNSDEDDELKDALILVNLLKSALRDGFESSDAETTASVDMATCATITEGSTNSTSSSPRSSKEDFLNTHSQRISTPKPPLPDARSEEYIRSYRKHPEEYRRNYRRYAEDYRRNYRFPYRRYLRRRIAPIDYDFYYELRQRLLGNKNISPTGSFNGVRQIKKNKLSNKGNDTYKNRRFDYEDNFGEHPNDTEPTITTKSVISTKNSIKNITATSVPKTITKDVKSTTTTITTPKVSQQIQKNKQFNLTEESTVREHEYGKKQKLKYVMDDSTTPKSEIVMPISESTTRKTRTTINDDKNQTSIQTTKDPIMLQVESELVEELKSERFTRKPTFTTKKRHKYSFMISKYKRRPARTRKYKPTLKIYLSKSTKIPIPFPENNAFCYTNPNNALCRTLI